MLDDGPAAGTVREIDWGIRALNVIDVDGKLLKYVFYAGSPRHRIARYKWCETGAG